MQKAICVFVQKKGPLFSMGDKQMLVSQQMGTRKQGKVVIKPNVWTNNQPWNIPEVIKKDWCSSEVKLEQDRQPA